MVRTSLFFLILHPVISLVQDETGGRLLRLRPTQEKGRWLTSKPQSSLLVHLQLKFSQLEASLYINDIVIAEGEVPLPIVSPSS